MPDIRERFRVFDRIEAPDLWSEAERRTPASEVPGGPRPARRLAVAALALAVAAAGLGLAIRAIGRSGGPEPASSSTPPAPTRATPTPSPVHGRTRPLSTVVALGGTSTSVVPGSDGVVYVAVADGNATGEIVRWDPSDGSIATSEPIPAAREGVPLAFAGGSVWAGWGGAIHRLDPSSLRDLQGVPLSSAPAVLAGSPDGSLWVGVEGQILVLDPTSGQTATSFPVRGTPRFISYEPSGLHAYVVTDAPAGRDGELLLELDVASGDRIASTGVGYRELLGPSSIAATDTGVWVGWTTGTMGTVWFLPEGTLTGGHPLTGEEPLGSNEIGVSVAGGVVWVTDPAAGAMACVDPGSGEVLDRFTMGGPDAPADLRGRSVTQSGSTLYMDGSSSLLRLDPPVACGVSG
ncbi:MAG: hypothetical protein ACE14W_09915 [Candidatus Velamenicoccus archaeovorus]